MRVVVFKNKNGSLNRAFNPNFGDNPPEILFQGTKEEYKSGDWDAQIQASQEEVNKPEADPQDLADTIVEAVSGASLQEQKALLANPTILTNALLLLLKKDTLTVDEYNQIEADLVSGAQEAGIELERVEAVKGKVKEEFKDKVRFKK